MRALRLGAIRVSTGLLLAGSLLSKRALAQEQNLGHRVLGTTGVNAGVQIEPGLYAVNGFAAYAAYGVNDRNGNRVPGSVLVGVVTDRLGVAAALRLEPIATYVGISVGVPVANISGQGETANVLASIDEFGLADLYVQPVRLGWRLPHVDIVGGFAVYIPTGHFEPGGIGSVGAGQFSRELSFGGTVYLDDGKVWRISAISSYIANLTKRDIDIRRGDLFQIQGGIGAQINPAIEVGVAGYGLLQVTDDSGSDLPVALRGAQDRAYGMGPEVDFTLPAIRSTVTMRYEHDITARSHPLGQIFVFGYSLSAWSP
jgi:hypothetical protein